MKCKTATAEYRAEAKGLLEQRNDKVSEMEALLGGAQGEQRAMTDGERAQFEKLEGEIRAIDETMAAADKMRGIVTEPPEGADGGQAEERAVAEERAFECFIRGIAEARADVNLTAGDSGAVIPSSIANKIILKVYDICPIYHLATRYNVGGTLTIPYYDESAQAITMAYATEFTELESTSGKFASVELKGFLSRVLSKVSKSLINNSQFDIVNFVVSDMAFSISRWIENELLNGTDDKVQGLRGVTQTVTTAAATVITVDELIDLQETVPDAYQGGSIWIMNKATRTAIRKLKDGDGNYILNKDATARWGYTLFGRDVYTSSNMPEMAAGAASIYYGAMDGLAVKLSEEVNIECSAKNSRHSTPSAWLGGLSLTPR